MVDDREGVQPRGEQRGNVRREAIRAAEHMELLLEQLPIIPFICSADGAFNTSYISERVYDVTGYRPEQFYDDYAFFVDRLHPDDRERVVRTLPEVLEAGHHEVEYRWCHADGSYRWMQVMMRVVVPPDGACSHIVGAWMDITARKDAEDVVHRSRQAAEDIVATVRQPLVVLDPDLRVTSVNRAFTTMFDTPAAEVVGQRLPVLGGGHWNIPDLLSRLQDIVPHGAEVRDFKVHLDSPTVGCRTMMLDARKMHRPGNNTSSVLLSIEDVTDRERAVAALEAHRHSLEAANDELEAFSYSVSHDLRAPLRAVLGFVRAFQDEYDHRVDDEGRRILGVIAKNTRKMGHLIDDLLEFSRMGRRVFEPRMLDMTRLVQTVFRERHSLEPDRALTLRLTPLPLAFADPLMIRQVWTNLIDNAVKYTRPRPEARIEIGGRNEDRSVWFWIRDNGVGFDMAYVEKIFGVFQRLHKERDFEGTGVGLAIVRRIIERHGGHVGAEGVVDRGARFEFTLPIPEGSHA